MQVNSITSISNSSQLNFSKINNNNFAKTNLMSKANCDCVEIKKSKDVNFSGKAGGIAKMVGGSMALLSGATAGTSILGAVIATIFGGVLTVVGCNEMVKAICKENPKNEDVQKTEKTE